jgi:hypothetical protein
MILNNNAVTKTVIFAGAGLAVVGIALFVGLWVILGNMEVAEFPRLILSLCIPPAIMALLLGGYILLVRPSDKTKNEEN